MNHLNRLERLSANVRVGTGQYVGNCSHGTMMSAANPSARNTQLRTVRKVGEVVSTA